MLYKIAVVECHALLFSIWKAPTTRMQETDRLVFLDQVMQMFMWYFTIGHNITNSLVTAYHF
jgi:hypothetical protein